MDTSNVYDSLRQELLETYNRQVNLVTFAFTAVAALVGYGFTVDTVTSLIFLLPLLILAPLCVHLNNSMYTILTISVYLRVNVESGASCPKWETDIGKLRARLRKDKPIKKLKFYNPLTLFDSLLYAVTAATTGLVCIAISLLRANVSYEYWLAAFFGILWVVACAILLQPQLLANSGSYEIELEKEIGKLDSRDGQASAASSNTQEQESHAKHSADGSTARERT